MYLTNVEPKNVFHVGWQFNEEHVPPEIVARVSDKNSPEGTGFQKSFPRDGQVLQINCVTQRVNLVLFLRASVNSNQPNARGHRHHPPYTIRKVPIQQDGCADDLEGNRRRKRATIRTKP